MTGLHLGFGLSLRLGTFMWIGMVGQLGLFPGWFWYACFLKSIQRLRNNFRDSIVFKLLRTPERSGLKVYYPAHCERCGIAARLLQSMFLIPGTEVAPAVAPAGEDFSVRVECSHRRGTDDA